MLYEHHDYRSYLKRVLAQKISSNPRYSIRAFARQLSLHHSTLISVFKNQKRISRDRAPVVAAKLGLNDAELEYFCLLVELETTKNLVQKSSLMARISSFRKESPAFDLAVDHFKLISDWYHFPILEMVGEPAFNLYPSSIAERLGIHPIQAEDALDRLERVGLIEKAPGSSVYLKKNGDVKVHSLNSNEAIQKFHEQMLEKAKASLGEQAPTDRIIQTQTFSFDKESLKEVDKETDFYFERVVQLSKKRKKRDQIYHLSTVFFNLTPERKKI